MGAERDDQNSHSQSGPNPKLSLAGRLDGSVDGRPFRLVADNRDLLFAPNKLSTLLLLQRSWRATLYPLREIFRLAQIRLLVRIGWFGNVEVFPKPNYLLRLFLPKI
jgi:hypothetical protein